MFILSSLQVLQGNIQFWDCYSGIVDYRPRCIALMIVNCEVQTKLVHEIMGVISSWNIQSFDCINSSHKSNYILQFQKHDLYTVY